MANRSLGSLVINLIAQTSGFVAGMDKAARVSEDRLKRIERNAKIAGAAIGAGLAAAGAITARSIKNAVDQADDLSKLSQKIGISIEALSRLDYAAKLSDVSLDQLGNGVKRLGQFQVEAIKGGNEQALILERLGISAKDAATGGLKDAETMLQELAGIFEKLPDGADKTALAIKLFGKSGADLIPLLNNGAKGLQEFAEKADRTGYTLTTNTGKAAETFNDTLSEVGLTIDGLWRQSLPALLPKLQEFAGLINSDDFRQGFATIINGAVTAVGALAKFASTTASVTKFLGEEVAARLHGPALDDTVRIEQRIERLQDTIKGVQALADRGVFGIGDFMDSKELIPSDFIKRPGEVLARLQGELDKEQNKLRIGVELQADAAAMQARAKQIADEAAKAIDVSGLGLCEKPEPGGGRPRALSLPDFGKDAADELREAVQRIMDARQQFEALAATLAGPLAAANYQYQQDQERLNELARTGEIDHQRLAEALENLRKEHEADVKAIQAHLTPAEEYIKYLREENEFLSANRDQQTWMTAARYAGADATHAQVEEAYELLKVNEQLAESMRNWDELNRNIADSLYDIVSGSKSAKDGIVDFFDSLNRQILQNITEDWADSITDFLKGFGKKGGGDTAFGANSFSSGGGGWLQNLLSVFGFGGGMADGGMALPRHLYEVNERGLEMATVRGRDYLLTGSSPAKITPNHKLGSGGFQQQVHFNVQGKIDYRTQSQIAMSMHREGQKVARRLG